MKKDENPIPTNIKEKKNDNNKRKRNIFEKGDNTYNVKDHLNKNNDKAEEDDKFKYKNTNFKRNKNNNNPFNLPYNSNVNSEN